MGRRFIHGADLLPPPKAPPQQGPDRKDPAHLRFSQALFATYNPMKWLAKPSRSDQT